MKSFRIGQGFDVHKLSAGRRLIIGGVEIPYNRGLDGHSDADVLVHAIMDALLGAAGLGDIGIHFPPSDAQYKDADSIMLLKEVARLVREAGYLHIINIDCTIIAERPKMAEYIPAMRDRITDALEMDVSCLNIKATTTEKLGFTGREEGIAALSVCLIASHE